MPKVQIVLPSQLRMLIIGVAIVLVLIVIGPLITLLLSTLDPYSVIPFPPQQFALNNYEAVFENPYTYQVLFNTLQYALGSIAVGLPLGVFVSWLVGRSDMPHREAIFAIAMASFAMPAVLTAFGWVLLASPQNGVINVFLREVVGINVSKGPINIYTMEGMIFVTGIALVPSVIVLLAPLFAALDRQLEEAATTSGAGVFNILRHVTLPLVFPGLVASFIFFTVLLIQVFEIPVAIGLKAGIPVLSTHIFLLTQPLYGTVQYSLAATFSLIALVTGVLLMTGYFLILRRSRQFEVLGGKGYRAARTALGRWKYPALVFVCGIFLLSPGLVFLILLWTALAPPYVAPSWEALSTLSFTAFGEALGNLRVVQSIGNTVILVVTSATVTMLLASLVAWLSQRSQVRGAHFLDQVAFMPLSMPGIVVSLALALLLARTPIYGTIWIIVLGHVIYFLPFGVRTISSAVVQIHKEQEEAGATSGAGKLGIFQRIILPLLIPAWLNGWAWVLGHSMRDFTFPLMLQTTQNAVVATMIWELWNQPNTRGAAALSVVIVVLLGFVLYLVRRFAGRMSPTVGMTGR